MTPDLIKRARVAIEDLSEENDSLSTELERTKQAQNLAFKLFDSGAIVAEDLEEKIAEFSQKSKEELHVFEKAAEMAGDPGYEFGLGSLSDRPQDDGSLDPLTKMLITDL